MLWGKGIGGAVAFSPGLSSQCSSGAGTIGGGALDTSGNRYVTDKQNNKVLEITASRPSTTLPFTGLSGPTQIGVDALGTAYVLDSGNDEIEALPNGGTPFTAYAPNGESDLPIDITAFALNGDSNLMIAGRANQIIDDAKSRSHTKARHHAGGTSYGIAPVGDENTHYVDSSPLSAPATAVAMDAGENVHSVDATGALYRFGVDGSTKQLATSL